MSEIPENPIICFCNSTLAWGGGERWHLENAICLAEAGCSVILACGKNSALYQAARRELDARPALSAKLSLADWRFGRLSFLNPFKVRAFGRFLRKNRVTHLIMGLPIDLKVGVLAARKRGIRTFYRRGSALPVRPTRFNRFLYHALDALIVNSEETARCVLHSGNVIAPERVRLIYNGLDADAFDANLAAKLLERPHFTAGSPLVIGNAGRLNRQKGQKYLLHMSAALKREQFPHRLIIAGTGELENELRELAQSLGLCVGENSDVRFCGFLRNMSSFWNSIDCFMLSSLWEGFGYVLAEAMLAEKPLLAFNCNSMPEMVKPGLNGELIPPPSAEETDAQIGARMAEAVMRMALDPAAMARQGKAGRAFCLERFDQKKALRKLKSVLELSDNSSG